jgi:hypothetical protein
MATSGSGTGTPITSSASAITLAAAVDKVRGWLDDANTSMPLWSDQELTDIINDAQHELFADFGMDLGQDRSTSDVCVVSAVQGDGEIALDPRIVSIKHAEFDDVVIRVATVDEMNYTTPDWDISTVEEGVPTILVRDGDVGHLYPPLLAATGTLKLTVVRRPLDVLDYESHSDLELEISKFFTMCKHLILAQAYEKHDTDTEDLKRATYYRGLWDAPNAGGTKEKLRRALLRGRQFTQYVEDVV